MRICFLKDPIEFPHLKIDDRQLELVTSHKVRGLVLQSNLKWNNHIESIVTKASKRLHILRVLRRGGVEINGTVQQGEAKARGLCGVGQSEEFTSALLITIRKRIMIKLQGTP
ncbi:hypothetical protein P5673_032609 [Acropora cervicornis]|uniref:Uncharacterized protein n=1 Tax=Acropora cervicornis TaxID=6130 RepID=A0AAD9PR95_ACRCE|nr:hypothetical protein P5673_032609 [Acropora cervicornis]